MDVEGTRLDLLVPEPGCKIEDIDVFAGHVAVYQRTWRGQELRILDIEGGAEDPCRQSNRIPSAEQPEGDRPADMVPAEDQCSVEGSKSEGKRRTGLVVHTVSCGFPHDALPDAPSRGSAGNLNASQRRGVTCGRLQKGRARGRTVITSQSRHHCGLAKC